MEAILIGLMIVAAFVTWSYMLNKWIDKNLRK